MDTLLSAARIYVDTCSILENYNAIVNAVGREVKILPMIKANAYGSGADILAKLFVKQKRCKYLSVADIKEASLIRKTIPSAKILIIYQPRLNKASEIIKNDYVCGTCNLDFIRKLNNEAKLYNKIAPVHIEIDTGSGRLGVLPSDIKTFAKKILEFKNIKVEGLFMHYICAASDNISDNEFTALQTLRFENAIKDFEEIVGCIDFKHACSGGAIFDSNAKHFNMVRPGYMLYGYYPSPSVKNFVKLNPALKFASSIIHIASHNEGTPISYNRTFITKRHSRIATISAGYSDGISRKLSNKGFVSVNRQKAPIVGAVCMDLIMVDITDIKGEVNVGDEVFIFDNDIITVEEIAKTCETIGYEIISQIEDKADRIKV